MKNCPFSLKKSVSAAAAALLLTLSGCGSTAQPPAQETVPETIAVQTITAEIGDLNRETEFVGRLESAESVKVYPSSAGQILKTYCAAGQRVSKGDLLFELDTENLQTSVELAYLQYQSALAGAGSTMLSAESAWNSASNIYTNARDALENWRDLNGDTLSALKADMNDALKNYGKDSEEYRNAKNSYDALKSAEDALITAKENARDALNTARDSYNLVAGDEDSGTIGSSNSTIEQARISYENALKTLNEAKVYAPISGIVASKNASDTDMVSASTPVYVINSEEGEPVVSFNLSEDGADALTIGDTVTVIYNNTEYPAAVIELAAEASAATGLYAAKAQTLESLGSVRTGAVVKVKASTANVQNALLLPLDIVQYDENQPYVYLYQDGVAVRRDIVTGMFTAQYVAVESGLSAEDPIITTWHPDLKDGALVFCRELSAASNGGAAGENDAEVKGE